MLMGAGVAQHKLGVALREYRMLHQSRGAVPHHKLLFPPQLRCLPLWTLGELGLWTARMCMPAISGPYAHGKSCK